LDKVGFLRVDFDRAVKNSTIRKCDPGVNPDAASMILSEGRPVAGEMY
jgi:hypothetical protein